MPRPAPEATFNLKLLSTLPPEEKPNLYDMHVEIIYVGARLDQKALHYVVRDIKGVHEGILREDHMPEGINFPNTTDLDALEKIKKEILTHNEVRGHFLTKMAAGPSVAAIRNPVEYAQRHVVGKVSMAELFKGHPHETDEQLDQIAVFIRYSRLLQQEFMSDSIRGILYNTPGPVNSQNCSDTALDMMRLAAQADLELGDIVVPSYDAVMMMHIAAELVVKYQVAADDIQAHAVVIFKLINDGGYRAGITSEIDDAKASISDEQVLSEAKALYLKQPGLSKRLINVINNMDLDSFSSDPRRNDYLKIVRLQLQKKITNKVINEIVPALIAEKRSSIQNYLVSQDIAVKPTRYTDEGRHVSILGAAGSGKSTITATILEQEGKNKEEYAVIATDDYRGVFVPGTEEHENVLTPQVFVRTQDSAGLVKDIVLDRLKQMQTLGRAPDILVDGIKVNSPMRNLLQNGSAIVSVNVCLPDAGQVAPRAHRRAETAVGVADRGRHVNTSDLIKGHAMASSAMLESLPFGVETKLYNSAVKPGEQPKHCGTVDTRDARHPFVTVLDIANLSKFLAKKYLQEGAESLPELYYDSHRSSRQYLLDTQYKAEALLGLIEPPNAKVRPYKLKFEDSHGTLAMSIGRGRRGDYTICVDNKEALDNILRNKSQEPVMKALITRVHAINQFNADNREKYDKENYVDLCHLDPASAARVEFASRRHRSKSPDSNRFSDPGSFTEFLLGKNTSFRDAYRVLVGEDFYLGLGNKSREQIFKDRIYEMKNVVKAAKYDVPFYVSNEAEPAFEPPADYYELNDEEFDDGRPLPDEFSPSYRFHRN